MKKVVCLLFIVLLMLSACSQPEASLASSSTPATSEAAIQTETTVLPETSPTEPQLCGWSPLPYTSLSYDTYFSTVREPFSYCDGPNWPGSDGSTYRIIPEYLSVTDSKGSVYWTVPDLDDRTGCQWMLCDGIWAYGVRNGNELVRIDLLTGQIESIFICDQMMCGMASDDYVRNLMITDRDVLYFLAKVQEHIGIYRIYLPEMRLEFLHDQIPTDALLCELRIRQDNWNQHRVDVYYLSAGMQSLLFRELDNPNSSYRRTISYQRDSAPATEPEIEVDLSVLWEMEDLRTTYRFSSALMCLTAQLQNDNQVPALIEITYDSRTHTTEKFFLVRSFSGGITNYFPFEYSE